MGQAANQSWVTSSFELHHAKLKLAYKFQDRDRRLTDVAGQVLKGILA
jgi:hypothetical protein